MGEVNQVEDQEAFELDKDQLEALRLEAQSVSPEEQAEFRNLVTGAHRMFVDKMGSYVEALKSDDVIAQKFIPVDVETYKGMHGNWIDTEGAIIHKYTQDIGGGQAFRKEGNFAVVFPTDLWATYDVETKRKFLETGRSEIEAKEYVNGALMTNKILHEITHLYQESSYEIPIEFVEAQAYWVAREAAPQDIRISTPSFDMRADAYQYLLDKHGSDVHGLGFNKTKNNTLLNQIGKK